MKTFNVSCWVNNAVIFISSGNAEIQMIVEDESDPLFGITCKIVCSDFPLEYPFDTLDVDNEKILLSETSPNPFAILKTKAKKIDVTYTQKNGVIEITIFASEEIFLLEESFYVVSDNPKFNITDSSGNHVYSCLLQYTENYGFDGFFRIRTQNGLQERKSNLIFLVESSINSGNYSKRKIFCYNEIPDIISV